MRQSGEVRKASVDIQLFHLKVLLISYNQGVRDGLRNPTFDPDTRVHIEDHYQAAWRQGFIEGRFQNECTQT